MVMKNTAQKYTKVQCSTQCGLGARIQNHGGVCIFKCVFHAPSPREDHELDAGKCVLITHIAVKDALPRIPLKLLPSV